MANKSFIISVVLLIGAAIIFSGVSGSTGKYVNQISNYKGTDCAEKLDTCMTDAKYSRDFCNSPQGSRASCSSRYDVEVRGCINNLYTC